MIKLPKNMIPVVGNLPNDKFLKIMNLEYRKQYQPWQTIHIIKIILIYISSL